jgi:hypothetical protein
MVCLEAHDCKQSSLTPRAQVFICELDNLAGCDMESQACRRRINSIGRSKVEGT